jgi:hypothetical protein
MVLSVTITILDIIHSHHLFKVFQRLRSDRMMNEVQDCDSHNISLSQTYRPECFLLYTEFLCSFTPNTFQPQRLRLVQSPTVKMFTAHAMNQLQAISGTVSKLGVAEEEPVIMVSPQTDA